MMGEHVALTELYELIICFVIERSPSRTFFSLKKMLLINLAGITAKVITQNETLYIHR